MPVVILRKPAAKYASVSEGGGDSGDVDLSGLGASTAMDETAYDLLDVPGMAAGTTFNDPVTGTLTTKLTSATVPNTNQHFNQYSDLGSQISKAWGAGSDTYTILFLDSGGSAFLADYQLGGTVSNRRAGPSTGEGRFCWSEIAGEERIVYYTTSTTLTRYNTATNAVDNTGIFPVAWTGQGPGGGADTWLQTNADGTYFTKKTTTGVTALKVSDGTITNNAVGTIDECHAPYGTVAFLTGGGGSRMWDIVANTLTDITRPNANFAEVHNTTSRGESGNTGAWSCFDSNTGSGALRWTVYDESGVGTGSQTPSPGWYWGQLHQGGFWRQPAGYANQYVLMSFWQTLGGGWTANMEWSMAFVRLSDFSKKVVGGHYSLGLTGAGYTPGGTDRYRSQPHATVSFDGKLILFSSNMLDSGRLEVFLMETPRS